MLGALNSSLTYENTALRATNESSAAASIYSLDANPSTDEILNILNSSTGSSQQRLGKVLEIHANIVNTSATKISTLERQLYDKDKLVKELQEKLAAVPSKRIRTGKQTPKDDTGRQLEMAMNRIKLQNDQIKALNSRVETFTADTIVRELRKDEPAGSNEELFYRAH